MLKINDDIKENLGKMEEETIRLLSFQDFMSNVGVCYGMPLNYYNLITSFTIN